MRNFIKFNFNKNFSEYYLLKLKYVNKLMFFNQIDFFKDDLNYKLFDLGYLGYSNLIKIDRSYYVSKINVVFFSNLSSRLVTGRLLKLSHRSDIINMTIVR